MIKHLTTKSYLEAEIIHASTKYILFWLSFFLIVGASCAITTRAIQAVATGTKTTLADKDTGCRSDLPAANMGSVSQVYAGIADMDPPLIFMEAFFHFNYTGKPANLTSAVIRLYAMTYQYGTLRITIVDAPWEESTLNWTNRPPGTTHITDLAVVGNPTYFYINITDYITGRDEISIRLNATSTSPLFQVTLPTKEQVEHLEWRPVIIWTYTYTPGGGDEPPVVEGFTSVLVLLGAMAGIAVVRGVLRKKERIMVQDV
ncbi:MAG: DNRLRE domain-containing protein [Candidatus Sigynarchaeum springense]